MKIEAMKTASEEFLAGKISLTQFHAAMVDGTTTTPKKEQAEELAQLLAGVESTQIHIYNDGGDNVIVWRSTDIEPVTIPAPGLQSVTFMTLAKQLAEHFPDQFHSEPPEEVEVEEADAEA